MKPEHFLTALALPAVLFLSAPALAAETGVAVITPKDGLKWQDLGPPGLQAATVAGDMKAGPSRFFLKYPPGFVTPPHHHSADHYAALVSGEIELTAGGASRRLGPGSYFALTGQASHTARVLGEHPAVFFIQADGPWDVVLEK